MGEMKTLVTIMKKSHKLSGNKYVIGRISGMQEAVLQHVNINKGDRAIIHDRDGQYMFKAHGTESACEYFKALVTANYPDLCEFHYE